MYHPENTFYSYITWKNKCDELLRFFLREVRYLLFLVHFFPLVKDQFPNIISLYIPRLYQAHSQHLYLFKHIIFKSHTFFSCQIISNNWTQSLPWNINRLKLWFECTHLHIRLKCIMLYSLRVSTYPDITEAKFRHIHLSN